MSLIINIDEENRGNADAVIDGDIRDNARQLARLLLESDGLDKVFAATLAYYNHFAHGVSKQYTETLVDIALDDPESFLERAASAEF